jgi:hypothetical protein
MTNHPKIEVKAKRARGAWLLIVEKCPYCGKKHTHGGGDGKLPGSYGFRVPHCFGDHPQYELIPAPEIETHHGPCPPPIAEDARD